MTAVRVRFCDVNGHAGSYPTGQCWSCGAMPLIPLPPQTPEQIAAAAAQALRRGRILAERGYRPASKDEAAADRAADRAAWGDD
ncbi:MAG: hypothetical protein ACTHMS_23460 [Jatrophihabitans sp.]|uniref:hypothetical protein n=1 Tax=Jatrophihabitans sp. TaxID=1932789 RepID=UPI003F7D0528